MLDAHLHVVDPSRTVADTTGNPAGAWWELVDATPRAVVARVRTAGVVGGVFVQAVAAHGLQDNAVVTGAARASPGFVAMITVDPRGPDPIGAVAPSASGLRLFSIRDPWLDDDLALALLARCRELGITPSICCLADELESVDALLGAVDIEIALDHAGFVTVGADDDALVRLARHDNLVVKLSTGVFDHSALDPTGTVDRLVGLVGAERIAWGSDHPQVHDRRYDELVALGMGATAHLSGVARAAILEGTTARLWLR